MKKFGERLVLVVLILFLIHRWLPNFGNWRSKTEPGPTVDSQGQSPSAGSAQDQMALAEKAVRDRNPDVRAVTAEKVTDPLAREYLRRLQDAAEHLKEFNPNLKLTDDDVAAVRQGLPAEVAPARPEVVDLGAGKAATLSALENQALHATNPALRIDAVNKITDQQVLQKAALDDDDPNVRLVAVERLTTQRALVEVAMCEWNEPQGKARISVTVHDAAVSRLHLAKMNNPALLERVAAMARNESIREIALGRLREADRLKALDTAREALTAPFNDASALAHAAIAHVDPLVRHSSVGKLSDQTMLRQVAEQAADLGVRRAAVAKISDSALRRMLAAQLAATQPQAGEVMTMDLGNASAVIHLLWVPPTPSGGFQMGYADDNAATDRPHTVILTKGFWLGRTEVTQAQWDALMDGDMPYLNAMLAVYMNDEVYKKIEVHNHSTFTGSDLPLENVEWQIAIMYCQKLTERERAAGRLPQGYEYTLPTESQWEFASRAGGPMPVDVGDLERTAWYQGNSGGTTHQAGTRPPNAWGFCDMRGNVWEWCMDWKDAFPSGTVTDPQGPSKGQGHVARGGDWRCDAWQCRLDNRRYAINPGQRRLTNGFRLALAPTVAAR